MWAFMSVPLIAIALFLYYFLVETSRLKEINKVPGPKGMFIVGNAFDFITTPGVLNLAITSPATLFMDIGIQAATHTAVFYYFTYLANKYKDMFEVTLGNQRFLILHHPKHVETLVNSTQHNEKGYLYTFLRPWLHDGLLLSGGKKWHQRRKILTPAFHFNVLCHFNNVLAEKSEKLVENLQSEVNCSKTNVYSFITDFTINSICETAMGTVLDEESSTVSKCYKNAIHDLGTYLIHRSTRVWLHPELFFNLSQVGRDQKKTLNLISLFRNCVIEQRRQSGNFNDLHKEAMEESTNDFVVNDKKRLAMLDLLLNAEQQGTIDSEGINEEVDTFMFEGHDTTATALQFAFMLLANHPDVQNKVVEEYSKLFGSSKGRLTLNDLSKMKYLEACIKESLRLYPPVYFVQRKSQSPLKLSHTNTPPHTKFTILIFDLHRRSDQFIEPLEFRPERFLKEPTWHPFSYLPFSAGQRNCIGQKFAMMEMKLAISAVLSKYRLLPVTRPQDIVFTVDIILRTKDPIFVKFEKR